MGTVMNIKLESAKRTEESPLRTPEKKRPRNSERNVIIDDFDTGVIERIIIDFYVKKKIYIYSNI